MSPTKNSGPTRITRHCLVNLTEHEWAERGRELAYELLAQKSTEDEKADVVKTYRDKISAHKDRIRKLRNAVAEGQEERPIECGVETDFKNKTVRVIRVDTGELVEERPMTAEEVRGAPVVPEASGDN